MAGIDLMVVYYVLIVSGFVVTAAVNLIYGILAPWYRSETGRAFFTLLTALSLLLMNSTTRLIFGRAEWTLYVGMAFFVLYITAMFYIGSNIFKAQVHRYFERKRSAK
jgi:hypothetical protein